MNIDRIGKIRIGAWPRTATQLEEPYIARAAELIRRRQIADRAKRCNGCFDSDGHQPSCVISDARIFHALALAGIPAVMIDEPIPEPRPINVLRSL